MNEIYIVIGAVIKNKLKDSRRTKMEKYSQH